MVAAVATMAHNGGSDGKEWRSTKWALAAFAIIGLQQTAMAEPSHRGLADPARLRLPIFYLVMFAASGISCAVTLTPVRAATWLFGAAAAFASLFGQWLLLRTETIRYLGVSTW